MKAAAPVVGVALWALGVGCSNWRLGPAPDAGSGADADSDADVLPASALDCDWLAGENCMKAQYAAAMSCVAPMSEVGAFNADNTICTYPSGVVVTFDAPVKLPLGLNPPGWHFGISRAGSECLRFDSADAIHFTLVVNGATLTETAPPVTVTCPDGTRYSDATDGGLLSCDPGGLPSQGASSTETLGYFWIELFPTPVVVQLFYCVMPV